MRSKPTHPSFDRLISAASALNIGTAELRLKLGGISPQAIHNWKSRGVGKASALQIEKLLGIKAKWILDGDPADAPNQVQPAEDSDDLVVIPLAEVKASAGITGFSLHQDWSSTQATPVVLRRQWIKAKGFRPEKLAFMWVHGQSMEPTMRDGDLILLDLDSCIPIDGQAFVVLYEGETTVKRLVRDAGSWWLVSDNPDQRRYPKKVCDEMTRIVGKVAHRWATES